MNIKNPEKIYSNFLESLVKDSNIDSLYENAFKTLKEVFGFNRVLLIERSSINSNFTVTQELNNDDLSSLLKIHFPFFEDEDYESNKLGKVWKLNDIKNKELINAGIISMIGIQLNDQTNSIFIFSSNKNDFSISEEEFGFLIKLVQSLFIGALKTENFNKHSLDSNQLLLQNSMLREKDYLRTRFIGNLTHELKTPLSSILGFSKILTSNKIDQSEEKEISKNILKAGERLSVLVDDFLQICNMDSDGWNVCIDTCNIENIIKCSIDEFSALNKNHKIILEKPSCDTNIKTDSKLFRQIIDNLISNSIKYSPSDGEIKINIESPEKNKIKVLISDNGIGIEKDELKKVFNRFYRSKSKKIQGITGTGLGLSVCKEIISSLNGQISIESKVDEGTIASFIIPTN